MVTETSSLKKKPGERYIWKLEILCCIYMCCFSTHLCNGWFSRVLFLPCVLLSWLDFPFFIANLFDRVIHGENFIAIFTTLSVVIWFSTGTLGIFATLVYIFTMRVVIYDILSMAIIPTLSTFILFCNLCYILLWISPRSVVKIAIRI